MAAHRRSPLRVVQSRRPFSSFFVSGSRSFLWCGHTGRCKFALQLGLQLTTLAAVCRYFCTGACRGVAAYQQSPFRVVLTRCHSPLFALRDPLCTLSRGHCGRCILGSLAGMRLSALVAVCRSFCTGACRGVAAYQQSPFRVVLTCCHSPLFALRDPLCALSRGHCGRCLFGSLAGMRLTALAAVCRISCAGVFRGVAAHQRSPFRVVLARCHPPLSSLRRLLCTLSLWHPGRYKLLALLPLASVVFFLFWRSFR